MKEVTAYEAEDGTLHKTEKEALEVDIEAKIANLLLEACYDCFDTEETQICDTIFKHRKQFLKALLGDREVLYKTKNNGD